MDTQLMIKIAQDASIVRYLSVATATILAYDYCLTLDQEISFIWTDHWSVMHILYVLTRYMPFLDTSINLHHLFTLGLNEHDCFLSVTIDAFLFVVGIGITEIILLIRTWVVWDRDRRMTICMSIFYAGIWSGIVVSTWHFIQSLECYSAPNFLGCFETFQSKFVLIDWTLFMSFEMFMLVFILIKSFQSYARMQTVVPLFRVIYGDGILFYVYIVVISALNVAIIVRQPERALLLTPFGRTMHSVLTVRLVLKLRQVLHKTCTLEEQTHHYLSTNALPMHSTVFTCPVYANNRTVH